MFFLNNYNAYADLLDKADIYRPTEVDAIEPYTCYYSDYTLHKGTAETISRILQPYNIRAAHKPSTTLRHLLTNVKDRDESNNREGTVYKIKCSDCHAFPLVRLAETLTQDWLNTNERRKMVTPIITLLYVINWQATTLTGTLLNA